MSSFEPDIASNIESLMHGDDMLLAFPSGRHHEFQARPARVTVCVPVYNGAVNLGRCLASILSQAEVDTHIVVVDNASTDATFADACGFAAHYPNIVVYRNAANLGRVPNWNRCFDLAAGEFVKLVMVNDYLRPDMLRQLIAAFDRFPSVILACAAVYMHQPDGSVTRSPVLPMSMVLPSATALEVGLTQINLAAGPTVQMLRRSAVAEHGLRFDESYQWASDYDFTLRLLQHGDFAYVQKAGGVTDANVARFYTECEPVISWREDAGVVLKCFQETGALARGEFLEQTAQRLQTDYQNYRNKAKTVDQQNEMEQIFVEALQEFHRLVSTRFQRAA